MKMTLRLPMMKKPIVQLSLGKTFELEFHPLIVQFSKTDEFVDTYWIVMNKFYRVTKRIFKTDKFDK